MNNVEITIKVNGVEYEVAGTNTLVHGNCKKCQLREMCDSYIDVEEFCKSHFNEDEYFILKTE